MLFLSFLAIAFTSNTNQLKAQVDNQYVIKAAFIYKFTKFITWKEPYSNNPEFIIGVLGDDSAIIPHLIHIAELKQVKSRIIVINRFAPGTIPPAKQIEYCDIFFVPKKYDYLADDIFRVVDQTNTLLIGESGDFAERGGAINFIHKDNHINFEINRKTIESANFKIDPQLLKLAVIIDDREGQ